MSKDRVKKCPKCNTRMVNETLEWKCPKCRYSECIEPEYCPPNESL